VVRGHPRSSATLPFDRAHTTSDSNLTETMSLSCTVFEILSLIVQKLKRSRDSDHAAFRDSLSSVGWDLLWSIYTKLIEVSTTICNEDMKGNAKCKNSRFEPRAGFFYGSMESALSTSY